MLNGPLEGKGPGSSQGNLLISCLSIKRQPDGSFRDGDLANFLHNAYVILQTKLSCFLKSCRTEHSAAAFGARGVPG